MVDNDKKDSTLAEVKAKAIAGAISRGAKEGHVRIIEEDVSGIPYIEGKSKIVVKVVGPVDYERFLNDAESDVAEESTDDSYDETKRWELGNNDAAAEVEVDHITYIPHVDSDRVWHLSETDALYISIGCYILGCAGGGTPYASYLQTRQLLRDGNKIKIVDIDDLPEDALCAPIAGMGSPVIAIERLGGDMIGQAWDGMEKHLGIRFTGVLAAEIGGSNGMAPLLLSSSNHHNIPCVDADVMGKTTFLGMLSNS